MKKKDVSELLEQAVYLADSQNEVATALGVSKQRFSVLLRDVHVPDGRLPALRRFVREKASQRRRELDRMQAGK